MEGLTAYNGVNLDQVDYKAWGLFTALQSPGVIHFYKRLNFSRSTKNPWLASGVVGGWGLICDFSGGKRRDSDSSCYAPSIPHVPPLWHHGPAAHFWKAPPREAPPNGPIPWKWAHRLGQGCQSLLPRQRMKPKAAYISGQTSEPRTQR